MDIISSYRKKKKLTQWDLANLAGLYQMQISRAERALKSGNGVDADVARAIERATKGQLKRLPLLYPDEYNQGAA